ncbi:hypothetical protein DMENIID0001_070710 [Sergentomyia squamirostris]
MRIHLSQPLVWKVLLLLERTVSIRILGHAARLVGQKVHEHVVSPVTKAIIEARKAALPFPLRLIISAKRQTAVEHPGAFIWKGPARDSRDYSDSHNERYNYQFRKIQGIQKPFVANQPPPRSYLAVIQLHQSHE